jgi:hypothetical protein
MTKVLQRNVAAEHDTRLAPSKRENSLSEVELDHVVGAQNRPTIPTNTSGG